LLIDNYNNWGAEGRILTRYKLGNAEHTFLIGGKYYQSANDSRQGVGNTGSDPDFVFRDDEFTSSTINRFDFDFPNLNFSVFGENIFNITDTFSITPGFRFEYLKTESDGFETDVFLSNSGNVLDITGGPDSRAVRTNERSFVLFGLGLSYKPSNEFEVFANFSENYRSITFTDLIPRGTLIIDPDLEDETGFSGDIGIRGSIGNVFRYDTNIFTLLYDNRIGVSASERTIDNDLVPIGRRNGNSQIRTNVGKSQVFGIESLFTANISNWLLPQNDKFHWQHFLNASYTSSEYIESSSNNDIEGNEIEFVPEWNIKTGVELGYRNFKSSIQYTYVASQFTDIENSTVEDIGSNSVNAGVLGEIPAYSVFDFSAEYTHKKWKLEAGVNNFLDEEFFTRRATGYPGPGIIPSSPRNFYAVLQLTL